NVNKTLKWQDGKEQGMFFLTTSGDLIWFDRNQLTVAQLNNQSDLAQNGEKKVFFDLMLDKDNILWLSSTTNGVFRVSFPKPQFNLFQIGNTNAATLKNISVKTTYQARNGDIWVATRQSEVYRLDKNGNVKQVFSAKNYAIGNVYHIMEDKNGHLWFSTKGSGLVLAEINQKSALGYNFTRFVSDEQNPNSINGNDVYYTYEDSQHRIWVALFGGGLNLIVHEKGNIVFKNKFNSFENYPKYGL
ncbi:hybrid sensor histidine kinase/response regulator, partial [bacterium]|nr:hybrid sensor histidine kinase/response regulator [bacterium]